MSHTTSVSMISHDLNSIYKGVIILNKNQEIESKLIVFPTHFWTIVLHNKLKEIAIFPVCQILDNPFMLHRAVQVLTLILICIRFLKLMRESY